MALQIKDSEYKAVVESINKTRSSIEKSTSSFESILNSISSHWKSDASTELCNNIRKSLKSFNTYIDNLDSIVKYLNDNYSDYINTKNKNAQASSSLNQNGGA